MGNNNDLIRELEKIHDVLLKVQQQMFMQASANAALHMSDTVRPAPLVVALGIATTNLTNIIVNLQGESHE